MKNKPLISCITPTLNRGSLLGFAIESCIDQTYPHWEMIIIDDGSTDNTYEVVKHYLNKDDRLKYFRNPGKGGSAARNYGLVQAKGEYIAFLDDDDVNLPHRFESQLDAARRSGSNFIVSGYEVRDRVSNKLKAKVKLELKGAGAGFPSRWLIKKDLLDKVNGFDEDFPSMQDIELSYRLASIETFALHYDVVSILYHTDNSISNNTENAIKGKVLLMERLGSTMHPVEAASWYYTIAQSYFNLRNLDKAAKYFKLALDNDKRINFKLANIYFTLIKRFTKIIRFNKNHSRVLSILGKYKFPVLVFHPVVY